MTAQRRRFATSVRRLTVSARLVLKMIRADYRHAISASARIAAQDFHSLMPSGGICHQEIRRARYSGRISAGAATH